MCPGIRSGVTLFVYRVNSKLDLVVIEGIDVFHCHFPNAVCNFCHCVCGVARIPACTVEVCILTVTNCDNAVGLEVVIKCYALTLNLNFVVGGVVGNFYVARCLYIERNVLLGIRLIPAVILNNLELNSVLGLYIRICDFVKTCCLVKGHIVSFV